MSEALHGLPEGLVETTGEDCLQGAEDITGALGGLYEREIPEETPSMRGTGSTSRGCTSSTRSALASTWPTTIGVVVEQFATAGRRTGEGPERDPSTE